MRPADLNTPWAALLIDRLVAAGVTRAVISPGARSTPFALAAAQRSDLSVRTIVDERSAAFFALGQARVTGRPSLLICTSGGAAAHYLPAVIEAAQAGIPLIALTADRPAELQHRAAAQTIDQVKLFGGFARRYFELGPPEDDARALAGLAATAALAVATTLGPPPGPVHLNAWLRKPLEPQLERRPADEAFRAVCAAIQHRPLARGFPARQAPDPEAIAELAALCRRHPRGLIVCGPGPLPQSELRPVVERTARLTGFPVLAEATSQLRFTGRQNPQQVDFFDLLWRVPGFGAAFVPEVILQVGAPLTSGGFEQLLEEQPTLARWALTPHGWPDPYNQAQGVLVADLALALEALCAALAHAPRNDQGDWATAWTSADAAARSAVTAHAGAAGQPLAEAQIVRAVVEHRPPGSLLMVGNSLPVREVDWFCPSEAADCGVLAQRGANGIDGLVSAAAGAASAADRPVALLLGDVSFVHDVGGLASARDLPAELLIVVVNNGGGRMFELLPLAQQTPLRGLFEQHFLAPTPLDCGELAAAFGIDFVRAATPGALADALTSGVGERRCVRLVEAVTPGANRCRQHDQLITEVAARLVRVGLAPP